MRADEFTMRMGYTLHTTMDECSVQLYPRSLFTFIYRSICECKYCANSQFDFLAVRLGSVRSMPTIIRWSHIKCRDAYTAVHSTRARYLLYAMAASYSMVKLADRISMVVLYYNILNDNNNAASVGRGGGWCAMHSQHPQYARVLFNCTWMFYVFCFHRWLLLTRTHTRVPPTIRASPALIAQNIIRRE